MCNIIIYLSNYSIHIYQYTLDWDGYCKALHSKILLPGELLQIEIIKTFSAGNRFIKIKGQNF